MRKGMVLATVCLVLTVLAFVVSCAPAATATPTASRTVAATMTPFAAETETVEATPSATMEGGVTETPTTEGSPAAATVTPTSMS